MNINFSYKQASCMMLFLSITLSLSPKILIFTYSYNRPDFIEVQYKAFKKFLKDEYEFVVFNDAAHENMKQQIDHTCNKLCIRCIRIPQEIHSRPYLQRWPGEDYNHPTCRNCNVVQYSLDHYGFQHDDIVTIVDSDLFLVKEFSIREFMRGYDLGGLNQTRGHINYISILLSFLDMRTLPNKTTINFNSGRVEGLGCDTGAQTYYYLKNNPQTKVHYFDTFYVNNDEGYDDYMLLCDNCRPARNFKCDHNTELLQKLQFDNNQIKLIQAGADRFEFLLNHTFLHYGRGSNWNNKSSEYHMHKTKICNEYMNDILQDKQ